MGISTQLVNFNVENFGNSSNYSVTQTGYAADQAINFTNVTNNIYIDAGYNQQAFAPDYGYNNQPAVTNNYFISLGEQQPQQNVFQTPNPNIFNISDNPIVNLLNAMKAAKQAQQNQADINSLKGIVNYLKTLVEYKKTIDELAEVRKSLAEINKNKNKNWAEKTDTQREKDAGKICNKLDKLGFKQELIDKLQTALEKGNIEDLPKSKLKKFNKIMNKIANIANNSTRLTQAQIAKYSTMIEEAVNMIKVDDEKLTA